MPPNNTLTTACRVFKCFFCAPRSFVAPTIPNRRRGVERRKAGGNRGGGGMLDGERTAQSSGAPGHTEGWLHRRSERDVTRQELGGAWRVAVGRAGEIGRVEVRAGWM